MKYCKKCIHFRKNPDYLVAHSRMENAYCLYQYSEFKKNPNLVTGEYHIIPVLCKEARRQTCLCGCEGKFFKERKSFLLTFYLFSVGFLHKVFRRN